MGAKSATRSTQSCPKPDDPAVVAGPERAPRSFFRFALLLAGVALVFYLPVLWNGFVNYDDPDYVTSNAQVQKGLSCENLVWAFTTGHASNWHPLTWLSHMADWQIFGSSATGPHFVNLLFHVANAVLLFYFFAKLTGAFWRSMFVAGLFALHPLHVESVAWISERKDVLSGFFFFLTLIIYSRYAEGAKLDAAKGDVSPATGPAPITRSVHLSYFLSLLLFCLGLLSKPMLVTLPFVLLLLDYWPLQRFPCSRRNIARLLVEKLPFLLLSAVSCVITYLVQKKGGAVSFSLSFPERVANALCSYLRYIEKMFWPTDLSVLYPHPGHWPLGPVIVSAVVIGTITFTVFALRARLPWLLVGWLWFLGMMVPVIGLIQVGIQSMADRYSYLPHIGLFIILAWQVPRLVSERHWRLPFLTVFSGLCLLACGVGTWGQTQFWHDSETLFRRAARVTDRNYLAYNNLGFYLSEAGKLDEAILNYRKSVEINPAYEDALNNLGHALATQKKFEEALRYYDAALRVQPRHVEVHNNLGNALSEMGRLDEAVLHYRFVLQENPRHADAHNNLGIALAMQGKLDEAIEHFHEAIRSKPAYASAHSNLGNALAAQRKFNDAIVEYREALRLKPDDSQGHNNLGNVLTESGRIPEGINQYEEALRLAPINPETHFNLAIALSRTGKRAEAITHLEQALRLKPDYAAAREQLRQWQNPE